MGGDAAPANEKGPRVGARVTHGHDACYAAAVAMLQANDLPAGLLPLDDILEVGFVEATGYFWVQQKQPKQHCFPVIDKTCRYETLITGRAEKGCLRDLTGITSKEALFLWVPITTISSDPAKHRGQLHFKTQTGLARWLPQDAFVLPSSPIPSAS